MVARWDELPAGVRVQRPRRKPRKGAWRCGGVRGCGEVLTGTYAAAERHADTHHGARLECVTTTKEAER